MTSLTVSDAQRVTEEHYGLEAIASKLPGEYDGNFLLSQPDGLPLGILKVAQVEESRELVELQVAMIEHLAGCAPRLNLPRVFPTKDGQRIVSLSAPAGSGHARMLRLLSYVPGRLLADVRPHSPALLRSVGALLGTIDQALLDFHHPAAHREMQWDFAKPTWIRNSLRRIPDPQRRYLVEARLRDAESQVLPYFDTLRRSVIHGDANDYNVLVTMIPGNSAYASGLIDFGDARHTATISELAIGAAYVMLDAEDPIAAAAHAIAGYHSILPLTSDELTILYPMIMLRLAMSVVNSAIRRADEPDNQYLTVSEGPAWRVLELLENVPQRAVEVAFRHACGEPAPPAVAPLAHSRFKSRDLSARRARYLGRNLSLSYEGSEAPLNIVRGWRQYLYDADGRAYLDAYNNVAHVGHSHPRVVEAISRQAAILNTNTRYLHELIVRYAERLASTLPEPLEVCYFVNSASEANELALRLAQSFTGGTGTIISDGAYHGNTRGLIDLSPYKHSGKGGFGRPSNVHAVPVPDIYRGLYRGLNTDAGPKYASHVRDAAQEIVASGNRLCAFLIESLPSCAGQIVPPPDYLRSAFEAVREAGGVCIVDEVQVGFGRVGSHFWGFELQDVVPDIVVMGKSIGNGHPLGAVVTTAAIADAFDNGMEYFSTYGGNPVSMAAGMAMLDVLEREQLQQNARTVGDHWLHELRGLAARHEIIGDVRGAGMFLGVELVRDRDTLEPAPEEAEVLVNRLKEWGILTGTDGIHRNVIKLKPPMVFDRSNADEFVSTLDALLTVGV